MHLLVNRRRCKPFERVDGTWHRFRDAVLLIGFTTATVAFSACSEAPTSLPPAGTKLAFLVQPTASEGGASISPAVQVTIQDGSGKIVTNATGAVTLTLATNPGGGLLAGTTSRTAVAGIATFDNLRLDRPGTGYTLVASSPGLASATSTTFDIVLTISNLSTGGSHNCAVTVAGSTYCWGDNRRGQLGTGTGTYSPIPVFIPSQEFVAVSAGEQHSCGVTAGGAAGCWGLNFKGQLGDGSTTNRASPVPVEIPSGLSFRSTSAGAVHTCALTATGSAYCWGYNEFGQLGDGTHADRLIPVATVTPPGTAFASLTAGGEHTCGITSAGVALCWGYDASGQLGNGPDVVFYHEEPVLVQTVAGTQWATLAAGGAQHTCGITTTGQAYCWGDGGSGRIGDGEEISRDVPTAVVMPAAVTFTTITAGTEHSCALGGDGAAYCWGSNASGQLGDGTGTSNRTTPVPVSMPSGVNFVTISAGTAHTCALTTEGTVYCWGANTWGQLGNGSTTSSNVPVQIVQ